ncbi:MAG: thioredoxin family protein [Alphaproteobacteria bacterium]|nr:MAG: thioredoxin family protein [Alphaproteobacteria bacterium]
MSITQKFLSIAVFLAFAAFAPIAFAAPIIGNPAPDFAATDSNGKTVNLSDFKGRNVVLEWTNNECPFVRKHYESGNMQSLQKKYTAQDVVWLSIVSSAPGKQGHVDGATANKLTVSRGASPTAVLLDESGKIGKLYGAKTTPHMFIVDKTGKLAYAGAIDDINSTDIADVKKARNYIDMAFADINANRTVALSSTKPYGCSVKYGGFF